jgi:hypothetical protein
MPYLNKKGYKIEIKSWVGNFGNHLCQLSGALKVAIETESVLSYPDNYLIPQYNFDFRDEKNRNCDLKVSSCFFYHDECFQFPLIYDQERREISINYILPLLENHYNILKNHGWSLDTKDSLVINIRSGDIFRSDYDSIEAINSGIKNYVQPPLSFYVKVLESFPKQDVLIVTQPDLKNPVIDQLQKMNYNVSVKKHYHPLDDFLTLINSKYLVTCHSSFSWFAALMAKNLCSLHQPSSFSVKGVYDFDLYTYHVKNYISHGSWKPTQENLIKMLTHSEGDLQVSFQSRQNDVVLENRSLSSFAVVRGWVPESLNSPKYEIQSIQDYYWQFFKKIIKPRTRIKKILNKFKW